MASNNKVRRKTSHGLPDKASTAITNLKAVKVKTKAKHHKEQISKLERALQENDVEHIANYINEIEIRIQELDEKDIAVKNAKKSLEEIKNTYGVALPPGKGERGLTPGRVIGKKIPAKQASTSRDESPWITKVVGKFRKWLEEDIDISKDDFQDGCPDELKKVQADLVYIRNEMSRRFDKIRNVGQDNIEKLRQLYASLQKPLEEQVREQKNTTPSSDPDEKVVTDIKNLFIDSHKTNKTANETAKKNEKEQKNMSRDSNKKNESLEKEIESLSQQVGNDSYDISAFKKRSSKLDKKINDEITNILETLEKRSKETKETLKEIETLSDEVNGHNYDNTAFKKRTAASDSKVIREIQGIRETLESRIKNYETDLPEMLEELKHEVVEKTFKVDAFKKRYKNSIEKPVIATLLSIKQGCDQMFRNYETLQINCEKIAKCILDNNFSQKPFQSTPDENLEMIWTAVNKQQPKHEGREFEEDYRVHIAKIKPMLSEIWGEKFDGKNDEVKNVLHSVQTCLSEYRQTTKQLQEIDCSIVELVRFFEDNEKSRKDHTWSVTEATQRWKRDIPRCCKELKTMSVTLEKMRGDLGIDSSGLADLCQQILRRTDTLVDAESIEQELKMMENKLVIPDFKTYRRDMKGKDDFRSASRNSLAGNKGQNMLLQFIKKLTNEMDAILHEQQKKIKRINEEKNSLLERLNDVTEKLTKDISTLEADKKEAILRLSKLAGEKMTAGNPNIADLSDPNRPTKISEYFSMLYDTEWTDAYEHVAKIWKSEKDCCGILLNILQESDNFCRQQATAQRKMILSALIIPSSLKSETERDSRDVKREEDIDTYLKDMRQSFSSQFIVNLKRVFKPFVKGELHGNKELQDYAQRCVELCWYMCIQSPPVVIETSAKSGDKFNVEKYRPYTKKGNKIDFVTWPPLLLHENGPMLSKGVAEGK